MADFPGIILPPLPVLIGIGNEIDIPGHLQEPLPMLFAQAGSQATPPPPTPSVTDFSPTPSELQPTTPLAFTVTNATLKTIVAIEYPELVFTEVAYLDGEFTERYSGTRVDLGGGSFRFTILRRPRWPGTPTVKVVAISGGLEAT